jgi:hypothetical protein
MKKTTSLVLAALLMVAGMSCQKEESVNPPPNSTNKIKTYTEDVTFQGGHIAETFNVNYDNKDRVISLVSATTPSSRFEYKYASDRFEMDIYVVGNLTIHGTFYLNSSGTLVDSVMQYNDTEDTTLTKYVYNGNKQLVQQREYEYSKQTGPVLFGTTYYTYDANGLVIKEKDDDYETTYKYDKVIKNTVNIGAPYMPLPIQLPTQTITTDGSDTETVNYTYTFDSKNRLATEKAEISAGGTVIKTYTYY